MIYFNGVIPQACRSCFSWDGQKWVQTDPGLCDECDYMLDMFPMIDQDKDLERNRWALLPMTGEPTWTLPQE